MVFPNFTPPVRIVDAAAELNGSVVLSGVSAPIAFNGQRITQAGKYANGLYVNGCQEFDAALCDLKDPWVAGGDFAYIVAYIHGEGGGNITDVVLANDKTVLGGQLPRRLLTRYIQFDHPGHHRELPNALRPLRAIRQLRMQKNTVCLRRWRHCGGELAH